jgi:hypothetical protein
MLLCKLNVAINLLSVVLPHPLTVADTPAKLPSVGSARLTGWMKSKITKTNVLIQK